MPKYRLGKSSVEVCYDEKTWEYAREYCCPSCGLFYFGYWRNGLRQPCPECGEKSVYGVDQIGFFYAQAHMKQEDFHYLVQYAPLWVQEIYDKQGITRKT